MPDLTEHAVQHEQHVTIRSIQADKQIVTGLVYEPFVLDSWGEMMLPSDIELMAHRFMHAVELAKSIDTQHDNVPNGCYPIESFIARKGDPDYAEGSWVLSVKVVNDTLWRNIKEGKINGFSYQCMVRRAPAIVEVETYPRVVTMTEMVDDHEHFVYLEVDEAGLVVGGVTSKAEDGHFHLVCGGTATEPALRHSHRFFVP